MEQSSRSVASYYPPKLKTGSALAQTSTQEKPDVRASCPFWVKADIPGNEHDIRFVPNSGRGYHRPTEFQINSISTWSFEPLLGVRGRPSRHAAD